MCIGVETAQPGDQTTDPDIVMPKRYESSQRFNSLARVVITPVRHAHTRLHTSLSNICSSPSSTQYVHSWVEFFIFLHTTCIFLLQPFWLQTYNILQGHYRPEEPTLGTNVTVLKLPSPGIEPPTLTS